MFFYIQYANIMPKRKHLQNSLYSHRHAVFPFSQKGLFWQNEKNLAHKRKISFVLVDRFFDLIFLHFIPQRLSADVQLLGGFGDI